jgi:hypothetical protein
MSVIICSFALPFRLKYPYDVTLFVSISQCPSVLLSFVVAEDDSIPLKTIYNVCMLLRDVDCCNH